MQTVVTFCEVEWAESKTEVRGQTRTVTVDGKTFDMDLCDAHDATILGPVRVAVETYGRTVPKKRARAAAAVPVAAPKVATKAPAPVTAKYPCERSDCNEGFDHPRARSAHYKHDHAGWQPERMKAAKKAAAKKAAAKPAAKKAAKAVAKKAAKPAVKKAAPKARKDVEPTPDPEPEIPLVIAEETAEQVA